MNVRKLGQTVMYPEASKDSDISGFRKLGQTVIYQEASTDSDISGS